MIGGDFNLVRSALDKSSRVANERLIRAFNDFIGDLGLIEIHRGGQGLLGQINKKTQSKAILTGC